MPTSQSRNVAGVSKRITPRPDPLLERMAEGGSFSPVEKKAFVREIRRALLRGADVPPRVQDGPTCGLYALGMVMDYWDDQDPRNQNPFVLRTDRLREDSHTRPADTRRRLFDVARARGYTTQGEMFYAHQLAKLAREFGYRATVNADFTLAELKACIDRGHPALIGFDVDNHGNPGQYGGMRAHWAVIEGYFRKDGVDYLVATHGWTGKEYV